MVAVRRNAHRPKRAVHCVDFLGRRAINDARATQSKNQPSQRTQPSGAPAFDDLKAEVRTMGRGSNDQRILEGQNPNQVVANRSGRRRSQGQDWGAAIAADHLVKPQIRRAKIVSPLRGAVRFIHGKERNAGLHECQPELLAAKRLRGSHHQEWSTFGDPRHRFTPSLATHCTVDTHHGNPAFFEAASLVLKQGQQRRNHHDRLGHDHRGDLVTSRLAIARGQND